MYSEVGPVSDDERLAEVLQIGFVVVLNLPIFQHHPVRPTTRLGVDRTDPATFGARAHYRRLGHLDLPDHPAGARIMPREVDARRLTDHAASSVAADKIFPSQGSFPGHHNLDAGVVLSEARHLSAAKDGNPELVDPSGQDPFDMCLPQPEQVVVARGEVADVQLDVSKSYERVLPALG